MKIVIDTNVFISAFLWQRRAKEIFIFAENEEAEICVDEELLDEFQNVLKYSKFKNCFEKANTTAEEIIDEFLEIVKIYPVLKLKNIIVSEDPDDDKILLCALSSGADFIISGDNHLLKLKKFEGIPIINPRQFLEKFKK